jgi:uncharacterized protein (TIGR01777 family)
MKKIVIAGASGFVGTNLQNYFKALDFKVIALKRKTIDNQEELIDYLNEATLVVNLSGANIINRWTDSYKELLYNSRIDTTRKLVNAMKETTSKPSLFISTSAVGIYKNDKVYDESTKDYTDDFLGKLALDWEEEANKAKDFGIRTAIFRFGIVLGKDGGALQKMLTPFKLGLGGTIGDGSQAFSFIHIDDLLNAYSFLLDNKNLDGVFNLTGVVPTTNYGLTKALGRTLHRPTILPVPQFVLNCIFSEGAKVLTDGQSAVPKRLIDAGFKFKYENIDDAIKSLV